MAIAREVKLPPGSYLQWGGQFENQQRAIARLKIIIPISVFLIFVLLFWAFGFAFMFGPGNGWIGYHYFFLVCTRSSIISAIFSITDFMHSGFQMVL